jgi:hypothetical protein
MHTASVYAFLDTRAKAYDSKNHGLNLNLLITELLEHNVSLFCHEVPNGSPKVRLVYLDGSEVLFTHEEGFHASYVPQIPDEVAPTPAPKKKAAPK